MQRWLLPVLAGLFFVSGTSGLIYQSLWLRLLSLVFGVTVYAASTVLASFMAGLALGTLVAGRLTTRIRRPLAWFGATEPGIGGLALLTPWALDLVAQVWIALQDRVSDQPWALTAARFVCSLAVLLAPTMLMGATLPLVVRSSLAGRALAGPGVGVLYATNTAGLILTDDRPLVEYHRSLPRGEHDIDTSGLTGDPTRHVTARVPPSTP